MRITVAMHAHRKMKGLGRYRSFVSGGLLLGLDPAEFGAASNENLIGIYQNHEESIVQTLLLTDQGFYFQEGVDRRFVAYRELAAVEMAGGFKPPVADTILLRLRDGEVVPIAGLGGDPTMGTWDAYSLLMFLESVIRDLARQGGASTDGPGSRDVASKSEVSA